MKKEKKFWKKKVLPAQQTRFSVGRICSYVCPHTTIFDYCICVLTLLYPTVQVGPVRAHICVVLYTTIYVSSYYCRARRRMRLLSTPLYNTNYTSSYYTCSHTVYYLMLRCILILLHTTTMCPHTTIYYYTGGAGKGALAAGRVSVAAGASKTQQRIDAASRSHTLVA